MKECQERIGTYAINPSTILYNKELKSSEKILYAMINSLACKEGYCFATNKYFAEELEVHSKTVSSWISHLKKKNFIIVEVVRNEKKQVVKRKIYLKDAPYPLNNRYRYTLNNGQAIHQNTEDNIIRNNNINNNNEQKKFISNYTNQREYSEEFLNSLYVNSNM